ncbi:hypothetical protein D0Y96_010755 [Acidipila sp. 4G-K13]|uniref:Adenylate cyclase n=1 Tax=Paracidobacterium acidisoli TaxID=2303751 RepID=A0A372IR85_9BACT|nr:hypothetical protein [Paracidobacterium acidisoli]
MQNSEAEPISDAARRELVARIVDSRWFKKSDRLSSFLLHICELDLQGRSEEISEYRIGRAVFGRPENYDPAVDGIVRSHASRLRMRLDQYFTREGRDEPIRLSIPRGAYLPLFMPLVRDNASAGSDPSEAQTAPVKAGDTPFAMELQPASPASAPSADTISATETAALHFADSKASRRQAATTSLAWGLVAFLTAALLVMYLRDHTVHAGLQTRTDIRHPLWSEMFSAAHPTMIIVGDSSFVLWQDFLHRNIGLASYLSSGYRAAIPQSNPDLQKEIALMAGRRYTSIVDLEAVQSFTRIAQSAGGSLDMRYARDIRPNDLKQGNIILIGTAETNPWVQLFEHDMNFVFNKDRTRQIYSVINRNPRKGEPGRWDYSENDALHRVYGVVAYLPNPVANANVLILEGTAMAGTECGRDFIADDMQLLPFLKRIRRADGRVPHFEVVLGTDNISGSAVNSSILAWRTMP